MSNETADILDRAADALWMYGRCTGAPIDEAGRMCVLGAVRYAGTGETDRDALLLDQLDASAVGALALHVGAITGYCGGGFYFKDAAIVHQWNDGLPVSPENDAEVIDTIRRCAKDLRNNEGEQ